MGSGVLEQGLVKLWDDVLLHSSFAHGIFMVDWLHSGLIIEDVFMSLRTE